MKMQKKELVKKINKLKSIVPKKTTMPVLQGILVKNGYFIANNNEMTVKAKIEDSGNESFIIPEKAFDLINNLPNGEIEIVSEANHTIMIKMEKIKNTYQTIDPDNFPVIGAQEKKGKEIRIKSERFLEAVKHVLYAIPDQNPNQAMSSLCLKADGGMLNFVGLDGHVIAWDKMEFDGEFELLMPKSTAEKIQSLEITGDLFLSYNESFAELKTEDYEICTRVVNGQYYNFQNMFSELPLHTSVNRKEFLDAVIRAKLCGETSPVQFEISGSELNISINSTVADYHETIFLHEEFQEDFMIAFNSRLVMETLKAFECEDVDIQLKESKYPAIIEDKSSHFRAVVLPVAIH